MRNTVDGSHSLLEFDSIADLRDTVYRNYRDVTTIRHIPVHSRFYGVDSVNELFELARVGWEEQLGDALAVAEDTVRTVERSYDVPSWQSYHDVSGSDVDIARYLSGEPEDMISYHLLETPRRGRVVSLAVNLGASSGVSAEAMIARGKAVVALVHVLESVGLRTELYADSQTKEERTHRTCRTVVKVKDAEDVLDPAMVMFALAHPAFFRGLILASRHAHPVEWHRPLRIGKTYGKSTKGMTNDVFPGGCLVLETVLRTSERVTDAEAFVVEHLKELRII